MMNLNKILVASAICLFPNFSLAKDYSIVKEKEEYSCEFSSANGLLDSKDAKSFNQEVKTKALRVKELRFLDNDGASKEFFGSLNNMPEVKEITFHYGLGKNEMGFLKKFKGLRKLYFWGKAVDFTSCGILSSVEVLHIEETNLSSVQISLIQNKFPSLTEFKCDCRLSKQSLIKLLKIKGLKKIEAEGVQLVLQ